MSAITFNKDRFGISDVKVNGTKIIVHHINKLTKDPEHKSEWIGTVGFGEHRFVIFGGRDSGGSPRDWFVKCEWAFGPKALHCTSAIGCVRLLEGI